MANAFKRIHVVVIDSVGIGEAPDSPQFDDIDVDTLGHIAREKGGLALPNLSKARSFQYSRNPRGTSCRQSYGLLWKNAGQVSGKDTMTGHWEIMGLYIDTPFRVFPDGFPQELIDKIEAFTERKVIGNKPASGTEIIKELGEEQLKTGALIVYTSADSVLQIAAHEEVIPLDELYKICEYCREITRDDPYMLGRIIARPFIGKNAETFERTSNRHDYALKPFDKTVMNHLQDGGFDSIALGKISDIFDREGVTDSVRTKSNMDGMDKLIQCLDRDFHGMSFLNLVDFDACMATAVTQSGMEMH